jgi:hypothetical protein
VAIEGSYAICGARNSAVIYHWNGAQWIEEALLREDSSISSNREYFGTAVAMGVDFAVVSNEYRVTPGGDPRYKRLGTVYVYKKAGADWRLWATLTGEDNGSVSRFGHALAVSGPYILVGAPEFGPPDDESAAVYLYEVKADAIVQHGRLNAADSTAGDGFGRALAMYGRQIAVKTNGGLRLPPQPELDVAICDFKFKNSSFVN